MFYSDNLSISLSLSLPLSLCATNFILKVIIVFYFGHGITLWAHGAILCEFIAGDFWKTWKNDRSK